MLGVPAVAPKTAISGEDASYLIDKLPPGDYKLFAWEDIEPYAYMDLDILRQYENRGTSVTVKESDKLNVEGKLIPAGQ